MGMFSVSSAPLREFDNASSSVSLFQIQFLFTINQSTSFCDKQLMEVVVLPHVCPYNKKKGVWICFLAHMRSVSVGTFFEGFEPV